MQPTRAWCVLGVGIGGFRPMVLKREGKVLLSHLKPQCSVPSSEFPARYIWLGQAKEGLCVTHDKVTAAYTLQVLQEIASDAGRM